MFNPICLTETSVIVTLTSCKETQMFHKELTMSHEILHFAVTDNGCDRLEEAAVLIPVTTRQNSILQLVSDFK